MRCAAIALQFTLTKYYMHISWFINLLEPITIHSLLHIVENLNTETQPASETLCFFTKLDDGQSPKKEGVSQIQLCTVSAYAFLEP